MGNHRPSGIPTGCQSTCRVLFSAFSSERCHLLSMVHRPACTLRLFSPWGCQKGDDCPFAHGKDQLLKAEDVEDISHTGTRYAGRDKKAEGEEGGEKKAEG